MEFTHFDEAGNAVMVDVSEKKETYREATACGSINMSEECYKKIKNGSIKKGDVLGVARIAGIMGTKRVADLIPLCHPIALTKAKIEFEMNDETNTVTAYCATKARGVTGVENEKAEKYLQWKVSKNEWDGKKLPMAFFIEEEDVLLLTD